MQIDFYPAGESALLILTGLGGNTKGAKYVRIAERITQTHGFSVAVAGVPENCWQEPERVFRTAVEGVTAEFAPKRLFVMGSSAGATLAVWYAHLFPVIKRVLAVNPVLNLNLHATDKGIARFEGEIMYIVSGSLDPCAVWQGVLPQKDNLHTRILEGIDHVFTNKLNEFISLPEVLFV